jgi:hypothetical protein
MGQVQFGCIEYDSERELRKDTSLKRQYKEKLSVKVGLHFKSFTDDVPAETKTKEKSI